MATYALSGNFTSTSSFVILTSGCSPVGTSAA
ncbi:hypothetical protein LEP1GSC080_0309, partial [Leptospira interrogans str. FPW2026]